MNKFEYAITAKKTRRPCTRTHYLDYLDYLSDHGKIGNVNFEITRGLHIHFIIKCDKRLDYNLLKPTKKGWNTKAVPVYARKGWIKYSRKDNEKAPNKIFNKDVPYPSDDASLITPFNNNKSLFI